MFAYNWTKDFLSTILTKTGLKKPKISKILITGLDNSGKKTFLYKLSMLNDPYYQMNRKYFTLDKLK